MLRQATALAGFTSLGTIIWSFGAQAHMADAPHAHPHSMDLFATEGLITVVLMAAAIGLLFVARRVIQTRRNPVRSNRGNR